MGGTTAQDLSEDLFARLYRSELGIQFLVKECETKDADLKRLSDEISELQMRERILEEENVQLKKAILSAQQFYPEASAWEERIKTSDAVLDAVAKSLRPLGLDKKKFRRAISEISRLLPNDGPQASRHALLLNATRKFLARGI
ncbi:hypothetical protein ACRBEV_22555 [Methylobacterium phyllosphaerae]